MHDPEGMKDPEGGGPVPGGDPALLERHRAPPPGESASRAWAPRLLAAATMAAATVAVAGLALVHLPAPLAAQERAAARPTAEAIADRVASLGDGRLAFAFEAREGVCGHGDAIRVHHDGDGTRVVRGSWHTGHGDCPCREGPIRVEIDVEAGRVTGFDARVAAGPGDEGRTDGARPPEGTAADADLGTVAPAEATGYLLGLARGAREDVGEEAVFAATLARGVEPWPDLLALARDDAVPGDTRRAAVFWLGQAAGREATEGLVSVIESGEELEVREHAIFALSQRDDRASVDALIRVARSHPEPALRRKALFWLGQRDDDPRVLALFEEILTGEGGG